MPPLDFSIKYEKLSLATFKKEIAMAPVLYWMDRPSPFGLSWGWIFVILVILTPSLLLL